MEQGQAKEKAGSGAEARSAPRHVPLSNLVSLPTLIISTRSMALWQQPNV
jgi:hypothetical protein